MVLLTGSDSTSGRLGAPEQCAVVVSQHKHEKGHVKFGSSDRWASLQITLFPLRNANESCLSDVFTEKRVRFGTVDAMYIS